MTDPSEKFTAKELKKLLSLAKQEGGKFGKLGADERFMVVNLKTVDKDGEYDLPKEVIFSVAEKFRERAPDTGAVFVTVGPTEAKVVVNIPESRKETNVKDWTTSLGVSDFFIVTDKILKFQTFNVEQKKKVDWSVNCSETHVTKPLSEGEFLKYRDEVINNAFGFLRSNDLLPEEESDEEIYSLD